MKALFQILFGLCVLAMLGMLLWSSSLLEQDVKQLSMQVEQVQQSLERMPAQRMFSAGQQSRRPHLSAEFPNLLSEDPYMHTTLPQQLGESFVPTGCRREAMVGRVENLHPFNGFRDVSHFVSLCMPALAQLHCGKFEAYAPDLAIKIEERPRRDLPQVKEYWVHLREGMEWQPLDPRHFPSDVKLAAHFLKPHPVTAADFKFFYDAVMNPYLSEAKASSLRTYLGDIETFEVIDDLTFVVRWKAYPTPEGNYHVKYASLGLTVGLQPLPCFVYQYFADGAKIVEEEAYRTSSIWAQNFTQHWAQHALTSCGPYLFAGMTEEGISFRRNPQYHNSYAALTSEYRITFKESPDAVWQAFKAGQLDMCPLSPNQLSECARFMQGPEYEKQVTQGMAIHELDYIDRGFFYLGWNVQKPWFATSEVRQALTQAIDRRRIIEQNLNQMAIAITGPFFPGSTAYDASLTSWPFNPDAASRLLEEAGWVDLDGDGIREKIIDGESVPFSFRLCYYIKGGATKVIMDYVATALKEVGIDCQLYGLDLPDLSREFDDKTFDAIFMGWKLGTPPDDPRQIWHSAGAKEKGSSNAIGFANSSVDTLIEHLSYEADREKRESYYHQFHRIIYEQNPYTFLYVPKVRLLYRDWVHNLFIPNETIIPGADSLEPNFGVIWLSSGG